MVFAVAVVGVVPELVHAAAADSHYSYYRFPSFQIRLDQSLDPMDPLCCAVVVVAVFEPVADAVVVVVLAEDVAAAAVLAGRKMVPLRIPVAASFDSS